MADLAHELTDAELTDLEKRIKAAYERAGKSVAKQAEEYFASIADEGEALRKAMIDAADDKTYRAARRKYQSFLRDKTIASKRFLDLQAKLAADLSAVNRETAAMVGSRMNGVFSLNHNFAAYSLEHELGMNLQFTLYDERTVARLLRDQPRLLPKPKIDIPLDLRWNQQKIAGEIAQGILTGEAIPKIAERLQNVVGMNASSAVRNARTSITSAENAGRVESYHYAESIGITLKKEWLATLDNSTREEHRQLDGQRVDVDEPFEVNGEKIMYPGDPSAAGYLVYNCRCSLISSVDGVKDLDPVYRRDNISGELIEDMSYKDWEVARRG
ncbi:MAG: hypothetical protein EOM03_07895 [Clostridia bacterium]|nr:hypothetical protein [Clostridia bacterium]